MRLLADTNLFIKFCRRLPLPPQVESALSDAGTERFLSPVSVIDLYRLWQRGHVPDNPDSWLDLALPSWRVLPLTVPIARQSVLWPWAHQDPADRLLAATAACEGVELWHTDTVLRRLTGFPHRYFVNVVQNPPPSPSSTRPKRL
jgi:PIN domain nuclease of toxin-antitoxin system